MTDDSEGDVLSWFYALSIVDQIALLSDPYQPLSDRLIDSLRHRGLVGGSAWVQSADPPQWHLSVDEARRLSAIRKQLDDWWDRLAVHEQNYIVQQRDGEFDGIYGETVLAATGDLTQNPDALVVALVRDMRNENSFRLPAMIRTYVEMQVAAASS